MRRLSWPRVGDILKEVLSRVEEEFRSNRGIDAVTLAGNGEPTLHPQFLPLMKGLVSLRRGEFPDTRIVVLTNGSLLDSSRVEDGLRLADEACFKLDAGGSALRQSMNRPWPGFSDEGYVERLRNFRGTILQSLFVRGSLDNTIDSAISDWIGRLKYIHPSRVDIYSLDRDSPDPTLTRVPIRDLEEIASRVRRETGTDVRAY